MPSHQSTGASTERATGTRDDTYDLVSVLYQPLQSYETAQQYVQDAAQGRRAKSWCSFSVRRRIGSGTWPRRRRPCLSSG